MTAVRALRRQTLAPFRPPCVEHFASPKGFHSCPEAVGSRAPDLRRLIGPFHLGPCERAEKPAITRAAPVLCQLSVEHRRPAMLVQPEPGPTCPVDNSACGWYDRYFAAALLAHTSAPP
jgi:hypothetical protein